MKQYPGFSFILILNSSYIKKVQKEDGSVYHYFTLSISTMVDQKHTQGYKAVHAYFQASDVLYKLPVQLPAEDKTGARGFYIIHLPKQPIILFLDHALSTLDQ